VRNAKAVLKSGDAELIDAVENGETSLRGAAETVRSDAEPVPLRPFSISAAAN
jgi:hypothetical protein